MALFLPQVERVSKRIVSTFYPFVCIDYQVKFVKSSSTFLSGQYLDKYWVTAEIRSGQSSPKYLRYQKARDRLSSGYFCVHCWNTRRANACNACA